MAITSPDKRKKTNDFDTNCIIIEHKNKQYTLTKIILFSSINQLYNKT